MDETDESREAISDAEAIDEALAAFEDACAQLTQAADTAADHPRGRQHLAAVREQLESVSVPVTTATADALLSAAADARTALQRVLAPEHHDDDETDETDETDEEAQEFADSDPVLDLAPESDDEPVEPPPAPTGYLASTSLPTRNLPHVLVFEDGRWQRGSIVFAPDDTLIVRTVTGRRGPGRRLAEYTPSQIARPQARG